MPTADSLLSIKAASELCGGLTECTLRRLSKAGEFPPLIPILTGPNGRVFRSGFVRAQVEEWVAEKIKAGIEAARVEAARAKEAQAEART
jgi:predicted DNA-binding transcriptional regulator AlpA